MVNLVALAFDHGRGDPQSYTMPLYDAGSAVSVPEWTAASGGPSPVGYVLDRLPEEAVVLARFAAAVPPGTTVAVRAVSTPLGQPGSGPSLPNLPPTAVTFMAGDSGWCPFPLPTAPLRAVGVGASLCRWTWQVRRGPPDPWTAVSGSLHKVYTVLSAPTAPWSLAPSAAQSGSLPSTEALDVASAWAGGSRDVTEAAARVTAAVNDLGGSMLTYDALVGAPHYCVLGLPQFMLDAFLDRLRGGEGAGPLVNCSDCATIVSTFANLLGADLWQSKMGLVGPGFALNPLQAIGSAAWSRPWGFFVFHEVAWLGACEEPDPVFDACVHTDADDDPTSAPHLPSLPVNQVFGAPESGGYRDQIAAPAGRASCVPQPSLRVRREVGHQPLLPFRPLDHTTETQVAARLQLTGDRETLAGSRYFIDGFGWFGQELPGWSLARVDSYAAQSPGQAADSGAAITQAIVSWWRPSADGSRLRIDSFETPSLEAARQTLLLVASQLQCPFVEPLEPGYLGDAAFVAAGGALVLFARANHVHVVRSVAVESLDVTADALCLDGWLTRAGRDVGAWRVHAPVRASSMRSAVGWRRLVLSDADARGADQRLVIEPRGSSATVQELVVTPGDASLTASARAGSP